MDSRGIAAAAKKKTCRERTLEGKKAVFCGFGVPVPRQSCTAVACQQCSKRAVGAVACGRDVCDAQALAEAVTAIINSQSTGQLFHYWLRDETSPWSAWWLLSWMHVKFRVRGCSDDLMVKVLSCTLWSRLYATFLEISSNKTANLLLQHFDSVPKLFRHVPDSAPKRPAAGTGFPGFRPRASEL